MSVSWSYFDLLEYVESKRDPELYKAEKALGCLAPALLLAALTIIPAGFMLNHLPQIPTPFTFSLPLPMMSMATAEHRPQIIVHREQGNGDSGDDDADHHSADGNQERDGSDHADGSLWEQVLRKYRDLDARLRVLEEKAEHGSTRHQT